MTQKPTLSDLLALRDGEGTPVEIADAVSRDAELRAQLTQLQELRGALHELPQVRPSPGTWEAIVARSSQKPQARQWPMQYAAAASVFLAAALTVVLWNPFRSVPTDPAGQGEIAGVGPEPAELTSWMSQSQALERALRASSAQQSGGALDDTTTRALEALIAGLDEELAELQATEQTPANLHRQQMLWQRRVALLDSLNEVQRDAAQPAMRYAVY